MSKLPRRELGSLTGGGVPQVLVSSQRGRSQQELEGRPLPPLRMPSVACVTDGLSASFPYYEREGEGASRLGECLARVERGA